MVKNPPAKQEMQIQPLGGEDSLEEEMATHSSILAWRIPQTKEPSGLQSTGSQKSWTGLKGVNSQQPNNCLIAMRENTSWEH